MNHVIWQGIENRFVHFFNSTNVYTGTAIAFPIPHSEKYVNGRILMLLMYDCIRSLKKDTDKVYNLMKEVKTISDNIHIVI